MKKIVWVCSAFLLGFSMSSNAEDVNEFSDCDSYGFFVASNWHKSIVCEKLHPEMKAGMEKTRLNLATAYPGFVLAIATAFWADSAEAIGSSTLYENIAEDPIFDKRPCNDVADSLEMSLMKEDAKSMLACWK